MELYPMVLAGHMVGDFILQTDWQAANKATNWLADLAHATTYNLALAALILPFWLGWEALALIAISFFSHAFIDRRWPTKKVMQWTRSKGFSEVFWGVISNDQALHLSILSIAYFLLSK